jgi:hypothetical protein
MKDIKVKIGGPTLSFKNSSASNFETYKNKLEITFINHNDENIKIIVMNVDTTKEIQLNKKDIITNIFDFNEFKNQKILISKFSTNLTCWEDVEYIKMIIPECGHVKIFLNVN